MRDFDTYSTPAEQQPSETGVRSFDTYGTEQKPAPPAEPQVGYGEDIGKGVVGGFGRGVTGLAGTFGNLGNLARLGLTKAGVPQEYIDKGASVVRYIPQIGAFAGPDSAQIQKKVEEYTGPFYQPKTIPGQYASTIAEFAPAMAIPGGGSLAARATNTLVGGIGSETMGQLTKGTAAEPYARVLGGVVAPLAVSKAITPIGPASQAHQNAVKVLDDAGIPLTAGQRTGSKGLQYIESNAADMPLIGGQATRLQNRASTGLDRAVTERVYDPAQLTARGVPENVYLPDPRVAKAGPQSLADNYTNLTKPDFVSNPQFQNRMSRAQANYENLVLPSDRASAIENIRNDITDRLVAGQGRTTGKQYQSTRSQIGDRIRASTNTEEKAALIEYKKALDEAYLAGLPPADARALIENNRRYALMKQVQPAVDTAGEHLSSDKLAQAVRSRRGEQYAARQGDLDELAAAAKIVMKPLPNSGTAARSGAQQMFMGGGGGIIGSMLGSPAGPAGAGIGAALGAALPFATSAAATSRLGQAYLSNRVMPQNIRDIIAQTMTQQAASQPSGVVLNNKERDDYDKRRPRVLVYKE